MKSNRPRLIERPVVFARFLEDAAFAYTHMTPGAVHHLGAGILYYAMAYMSMARLCVCLGSGGGFVPRLMRQGQIDADIADESRTILIDADLPEAGWGGPDYFGNPQCFFRTEFDVEIRKALAADAAADFQPGSIDYLHIDANHAYEAVSEDFRNWSPRVSADGVITLHDTHYAGRTAQLRPCGVPRLIREIAEGCEWGVVDFPMIGTGTALLKRRPGL